MTLTWGELFNQAFTVILYIFICSVATYLYWKPGGGDLSPSDTEKGDKSSRLPVESPNEPVRGSPAPVTSFPATRSASPWKSAPVSYSSTRIQPPPSAPRRPAGCLPLPPPRTEKEPEVDTEKWLDIGCGYPLGARHRVNLWGTEFNVYEPYELEEKTEQKTVSTIQAPFALSPSFEVRSEVLPIMTAPRQIPLPTPYVQDPPLAAVCRDLDRRTELALADSRLLFGLFMQQDESFAQGVDSISVNCTDVRNTLAQLLPLPEYFRPVCDKWCTTIFQIWFALIDHSSVIQSNVATIPVFFKLASVLFEHGQFFAVTLDCDPLAFLLPAAPPTAVQRVEIPQPQASQSEVVLPPQPADSQPVTSQPPPSQPPAPQSPPRQTAVPVTTSAPTSAAASAPAQVSADAPSTASAPAPQAPPRQPAVPATASVPASAAASATAPASADAPSTASAPGGFAFNFTGTSSFNFGVPSSSAPRLGPVVSFDQQDWNLDDVTLLSLSKDNWGWTEDKLAKFSIGDKLAVNPKFGSGVSNLDHIGQHLSDFSRNLKIAAVLLHMQMSTAGSKMTPLLSEIYMFLYEMDTVLGNQTVTDFNSIKTQWIGYDRTALAQSVCFLRDQVIARQPGFIKKYELKKHPQCDQSLVALMKQVIFWATMDKNSPIVKM